MCVGSALEHRPRGARACLLRVTFPRVPPQQGRRQTLPRNPPRSFPARLLWRVRAGAGVGLGALQWHSTRRAELKVRCKLRLQLSSLSPGCPHLPSATPSSTV